MTEKRNDILNWFRGPRRFIDGLALLERHGQNPTLVSTLRRQGVTRATVDVLAEELRKAAGVTASELGALRRQAAPSRQADTITPAGSLTDGQSVAMQSPAGIPATETVRRVRSFREHFPFLSDEDCPDVLKVVVADLFTAYGRYKEAHAALAALPADADAQEAARLSEEVVENFLADRDMLAELEHYRDHRSLLGRVPKVRAAIAAQELAELSEIDLMKKLNSAKANQSKARNAGNEEALTRWTARRELLEAEIENRKKNSTNA